MTKPKAPTVDDVLARCELRGWDGSKQLLDWDGCMVPADELRTALEAAYDPEMPDWPGMVDIDELNPVTYVLLVKNAYGWSSNIGDGNQWDTEEEALAAAAELDKCWGNLNDDEDGNPVTREWKVVESSEADRMELID